MPSSPLPHLFWHRSFSQLSSLLWILPWSPFAISFRVAHQSACSRLHSRSESARARTEMAGESASETILSVDEQKRTESQNRIGGSNPLPSATKPLICKALRLLVVPSAFHA